MTQAGRAPQWWTLSDGQPLRADGAGPVDLPLPVPPSFIQTTNERTSGDVMERIKPRDRTRLGWFILDEPYAMGLLRVMVDYADVTTPFVIHTTATAMRVRVDQTQYARYLWALQELHADGYIDFEEYEPGLWTWAITRAGTKAARFGDRIHVALNRRLPDQAPRPRPSGR